MLHHNPTTTDPHEADAPVEDAIDRTVDAPVDGLVDVLVVGAGPAGCAAAIELARRNLDVQLIDRGHPPADRPHRGKTCGHCLSPRALPVLRRLGLEATIESLSESRHRIVSIQLRDARLEMPLRVAGFVIRRDRLDPALQAVAEEAGATLYRRTRLVALGDADRRGRRIATVETPQGPRRICARLVIGADGLGSAVARFAGLTRPSVESGTQLGLGWGIRLGTRWGRRTGAGCVGVSFDVEAGTSGWPTELWPPSGVVRMFVGRSGYLGLVAESSGRLHGAALLRRPRPKSIDFLRRNRGDGSSGDHDPRRAISELLARAVDPSAVDRLRLVGAAPMPWRVHAVAAPGVALVGDAAGYAEPFTGEGMTWAFESAALLGDSLPDSPHDSLPDSLQLGRHRPLHFDEAIAARYAALWRRRIGAAQRRCGRVGVVLRRPWLLQGATWIAPRWSRGVATAVAAAVNRDIEHDPAPQWMGAT